MKYILLIFIITVYSSCLTSLHPITSAENIIREDRVLGTWQSDEEIIRIQRFSPEAFSQDLLSSAPNGRKSKLREEPAVRNPDSIIYARGYNVSFQKNGVIYSMFGGITRINDQLYIDLLPLLAENPKDSRGEGFEYISDYLPVFTMAKLEIKNNQLNLHFLNGDFIKQQILSGNIRINHEKDELFDVFMITATTKELHQFLAKYGHDDRLFSKENSIILTRKG
jgi:hypothetical protein